jgi:histidinol-phosphate phosphatase family protein
VFLRNLVQLLQFSPDLIIYVHPNNHPKDSDLININPLNRKVTNIFLKSENLNINRGNLAMAGMYVVNNELLKKLSISEGDFVKEYCMCLLNANKDIYGLVTTDFISDMGTAERIEKIENKNSTFRINNLIKNQKSALFLDLDDTLIKNQEVKKLFDPNLVNIELVELIKLCNTSGIPVLIITNQPGLAKGFFTFTDFQDFLRCLESYLSELGAYIDDLFVCPHHPDAGWPEEVTDLKIKCTCRKPEPGLLKQAIEKHNIDLSKSVYIGDSKVDSQASKAMGIKFIQYKKSKIKTMLSEVSESLLDTVSNNYDHI